MTPNDLRALEERHIFRVETALTVVADGTDRRAFVPVQALYLACHEYLRAWGEAGVPLPTFTRLLKQAGFPVFQAGRARESYVRGLRLLEDVVVGRE